MEQKPTRKITVKRPIDRGWIKRNKKQGSLITTICTTRNVPAKYVEEIKGILD